MAQQIYRLSLQNTDFPLLSSFNGRPVIIPNQDTAVPAATAQSNRASEFRPKPVYCHNVIPVREGFKSVSYDARVAAFTTPVTTFDEVWNVQDAAGAYGLFSPAAGACYFAPSATLVWAAHTLVPTAGQGASIGNIGSQSYICWGLKDVYTINCATGALTSAGLTGIVPATDIHGITSANNYLIAWNASTIFWSSPTNPIDFAPSLITGAGSGIPTELRGSIIACYPALNGFYIYSTENIILAQYSGNAQFPWVFKDIAGAMAIVDKENVTHAAVDTFTLALTPSGYIKFSSQGAEPVFPEVSDFLSLKHFEDYNAGVFTETPLANALYSRITRVGIRFIVISYGAVANIFTHALIYDTAQQRWGKLKVTHSYCFNYPQPLSPSPMHQVAFMASSGAIVTMNPELASNTAAAVVIVGGISMTRDTLLTLHQVAVNAGSGLTYTVAAIPSADGISFGARQLLTASPDAGRYDCRITSLQHNIAVEGSFMLSNLQAVTVQFGLR